jgi:sialic acid synthase SpsE
MTAPFRVAGRDIGPGQAVYRIADAGEQHQGDVQLGYKLIETAGGAGAHAVVFDAPRADGPLSERDFKSLLGHAQYVGLTAFGTAASERAVAFLASLDVPAFVLSPAPPGDGGGLLRRAAATGKPLFIRTDARVSDTEIEDARRLCVGAGNDRVAILRDSGTSLIEVDGHVIMTRHTLRGPRATPADR